MSSRAYAEEVYAACATVGFTGDKAARLKSLLDRLGCGQDVAESDLLQAAQDAQRDAVAWAGRR